MQHESLPREILGIYALEALRHASNMEITHKTPPMDIHIRIAKRFEYAAKDWESRLQEILFNDVIVSVQPLEFIDSTMQRIFETLDYDDEIGKLVARDGLASVGLGYHLRLTFKPLWIKIDGVKHAKHDWRNDRAIPIVATLDLNNIGTADIPNSAPVHYSIYRTTQFGLGYPLLTMQPDEKLLYTIRAYAIDWMESGKAQEVIQE